MDIKFKDPMVSISKTEFEEIINKKEKELFKSFVIRLIHCTDDARYDEDIADDYCRFVDEMCAEYKEKYGEEVEYYRNGWKGVR